MPRPDALQEFIASTNSQTRPWEVWAFQGIAYSFVGKPAHARSSLRQARAVRQALEDREAESRNQELDWIAYFYALAHWHDKPRKASKLLHRLAEESSDPTIAEGAKY